MSPMLSIHLGYLKVSSGSKLRGLYFYFSKTPVNMCALYRNLTTNLLHTISSHHRPLSKLIKACIARIFHCLVMIPIYYIIPFIHWRFLAMHVGLTYASICDWFLYTFDSSKQDSSVAWRLITACVFMWFLW